MNELGKEDKKGRIIILWGPWKLNAY